MTLKVIRLSDDKVVETVTGVVGIKCSYHDGTIVYFDDGDMRAIGDVEDMKYVIE